MYKKLRQFELEIIRRASKKQQNGPLPVNKVDDMFQDVEQSFVEQDDDVDVLNETFREYQ